MSAWRKFIEYFFICCEIWRRVRDSNPRGSYPPTSLAGTRFRPLSQLSVIFSCSNSMFEILSLQELYTFWIFYSLVPRSIIPQKVLRYSQGRISPSRQFPAYVLSRDALSTTQPTLQYIFCKIFSCVLIL